MLKDIGRDLIRRTTQLNIGDQISTKHRAKFNELLSQLLDDKLEPIEFLEECAKLEDGLAFVI
jgi:hypothetical protein